MFLRTASRAASQSGKPLAEFLDTRLIISSVAGEKAGLLERIVVEDNVDDEVEGGFGRFVNDGDGRA